MKLAYINHNRCGERVWGAATVVYIPDEMGEEELLSFCRLAVASYLDAEEEFKKERPQAVPFSWEKYPDTMTKAEIEADRKKQETRRKEWEEKQKRARKSFGEHLAMVSKDKIRLFWNVRPEVSVDVDWGHRHGTNIDYGSTEIDSKDVPGSEPYSDEWPKLFRRK